MTNAIRSTVCLFSRPRPSRKAEDILLLLSALEHNSLHYQVNKDFANQITLLTGVEIPADRIYECSDQIADTTQLMICYGGDGTFLSGVRMLNNRKIPIVGINSGRLGFLANISKEFMTCALEDLAAGRYTLEERTLLHVEGDFQSAPCYPFAFNEFTIQRQGGEMISVEVLVNDEMIATYRGDGVLISTPSGSTAYSLSVGGPVVAPSCRCFVISPIAPHNLTMRPVVIPDDAQVSFKVSTRADEFLVSLDNRSYIVPDGSQFSVKKAGKSIFLVHFQNISFYDTLRNKMMWGVDSRDRMK